MPYKYLAAEIPAKVPVLFQIFCDGWNLICSSRNCGLELFKCL